MNSSQFLCNQWGELRSPGVVAVGCARLGGFVHGRSDSGRTQSWTNEAVIIGIKGVGMATWRRGDGHIAVDEARAEFFSEQSQ